MNINTEQEVLKGFNYINNHAYNKYDSLYYEFGNGGNIAKLVITQYKDYIHVTFKPTKDETHNIDYYYDTPSMLFNDLRDSYYSLYNHTKFKCLIIPYTIPVKISKQLDDNDLLEINDYLQKMFNTGDIHCKYDIENADYNDASNIGIKANINGLECYINVPTK